MHCKSFVFFLLASLFFSSWTIAAEKEKNLQFAGQWPYHPGKAIALDLERNYIFLGDGDIITILSPELVRVAHVRVSESGQIGGLFYSGADHLLYAACRTDGLKVLDVTTIDNPQLVEAWMPSNVLEIMAIRVIGSTAYVCCGMDGLIIADFSDITAPETLSTSRLPGGYGLSYAMDIYVTGDFAFAADLYNGIHIIDIQDPKNPDYIKGIVLAGASDLDTSDGYLYASLQGSGTAIIDISDPENAILSALFTAGDVESAVRTEGDFAWISYNTKGLRALNVSDKENPVTDPAWTYEEAGGSSLGKFPGVDEIFMADYASGLTKIDVTDKTAMNAVAVFDTPADAVAIDISGDYVFALDDTMGESPENEGLRILALTTYSKSTQFELTGFCPTPGTARDIKVIRDYAYVADGDHGLQIISISDHEHPEIIGNCNSPENAAGVFIEGNYAYVADADGRLAIIDITDKSAPVQVAFLNIGGNPQGLMVSGFFAYVANGGQGLQIINISDKSQPILSGTCDTPGSAGGVFITGNYAYVADGSQGLAVIDITTPSAPLRITSLNTKGTARDIMVSGDTAYIADGENGLVAIDVTNPATPILIPEWSYDSPGTALDVLSGYSNDAEELYAFIADGAAGVIGVNLSIDEVEDDDDGGSSGGGGCFIQNAKLKNFDIW